ncbi:MAG TPA: VOC family protein [Candidatus Acidoferrales bacterium]
MAKVSRYEQLDRAVQALLSGQERIPQHAQFAALLRVAAGLRDLPGDTFRARLKRHLQRSIEMATPTTATPRPAPAATPYLCVRGAAAAIEFYKNAFGATEIGRLTQPDGKIVHAEIEIGGAMIMLADELPEYGFLSPQTIGGVPLKIHLYFDDVDALVRQAVAAGARLTRPVKDEFYGHREGQLTDPFGYTWLVSTVKEELSFAEIERRFAELTQPPAPPKQQPAKPRARKDQTVIPYLVVGGPLVYADFLKQVFGAEETLRTTGSAGGWHIEMNFGGTKVMMGGPREGSAGITLYTATLHLYVPDADAVYHRALAAGATSYFPPVDRPYGERQAGIQDAAGNTWYIATHHGPSYIPEDMAAVNLTMHYKDADLLMEFLKNAFGAEVPFVHRSPEGTYARARIGETLLQIGETRGAVTPDSPMVLLTVEDADAAYQRALAAGAESIEKPADQPYGARRAGVKDPFGTTWYVSSPLPRRKRPRK